MIRLDRIDRLCKEKGYSRRELERLSGMSTGSISKWKTGDPSVKNLDKVAKVLKVSPEYLTGKSNYKVPGFERLAAYSAKVKEIVDRIDSGLCIPIYEDIPEIIDPQSFPEASGWVSIDLSIATRGVCIGVLCKDYGVAPAIIKNDLMIIVLDDTCKNGDYVVTRSGLCRVLKSDKDYMLEATNAAYESPVYQNYSDMDIIGKVAEIIRKF
jgi:transcriptional regulator with XRE-family HTH domain